MGHMILVALLVVTPGVYSSTLSKSDTPSPSLSSPAPPSGSALPFPNPGSVPSPSPITGPAPSPPPGDSSPGSPSPSTSPKPGSAPSPIPGGGSATSPSPSPPPDGIPSPSPDPGGHSGPPVPGSAVPPKSVPMNTSTAKELAKDYKDLPYKLVLVGKDKYVLPESYRQQGALYYNYAPKLNDIILISYSRSGNNWFSELLYQLVNKLPGDSVKGKPVTDRVPLLESPLVNGKVVTQLPIDSMPSPRLIRTQLPPSLIPSIIKKGKKVIYVARNPKDDMVSDYKWSQKESNFNGTIDKYFYYVKNGLTLYSPYWAHTKEGYNLRHNVNVLVVFAEEPGVIRKVARFVGANYTAAEMQKLSTYMRSIEQLEVLSWPKVFPRKLNKEVNNWIKSNIGKITFPNVPNLYA